MSTLIIIGVGAVAYTLSKQIPFFGEEGGIGGTIMLISLILGLILFGYAAIWVLGFIFLPLFH